MNIVDEAWRIIQKFASKITLESFLEKLRPIVEEYKNLPQEEIEKKVLEYIKNEKPFGDALAEGASYALGETLASTDAKKELQQKLDRGELGEDNQIVSQILESDPKSGYYYENDSNFNLEQQKQPE